MDINADSRSNGRKLSGMVISKLDASSIGKIALTQQTLFLPDDKDVQHFLGRLDAHLKQFGNDN